MSLLRRQATRHRTIDLPAFPAIGVELTSVELPTRAEIVAARDAVAHSATSVGRRSLRTATSVGRQGARIGARIGRSTGRIAGRGAARGWREARRRPRVAVGILAVGLLTLGLAVALRRRAVAEEEARERRLRAVA